MGKMRRHGGHVSSAIAAVLICLPLLAGRLAAGHSKTSNDPYLLDGAQVMPISGEDAAAAAAALVTGGAAPEVRAVVAPAVYNNPPQAMPVVPLKVKPPKEDDGVKKSPEAKPVVPVYSNPPPQVRPVVPVYNPPEAKPVYNNPPEVRPVEPPPELVRPAVPSKDGGVQQPSTPVANAKPVEPSTPRAPKEKAVSKPTEDEPSSKQSSEPTDGLNKKAINDIVKEHNMFRAREGVPPIRWNATLARYAQKYAEERRGDCKLEHSTGPYGENLMFGEGKEWTWKHTVDIWSEEKKSYDYNSNRCKPGEMCQHYTAVVWRNTTGVGCGRVTCLSGDTVMVCSYWPPGNYDGIKPF